MGEFTEVSLPKYPIGGTQNECSAVISAYFGTYRDTLKTLYLLHGKQRLKEIVGYDRFDRVLASHLGSEWRDWQIERASIQPWKSLDQVERRLYREYLLSDSSLLERIFSSGEENILQKFHVSHLCEVESIFRARGIGFDYYKSLIPVKDSLVTELKRLLPQIDHYHDEFLSLGMSNFTEKYFRGRQGSKLQTALEISGWAPYISAWKDEAKSLMYQARAQNIREKAWRKYSLEQLKFMASKASSVKSFCHTVGVSPFSLSSYLSWLGYPGLETELFTCYKDLTLNDWTEIENSLSKGIPLAVVASKYNLSSGGLISKLATLGVTRIQISEVIRKAVTYSKRSKLEIWMYDQFKCSKEHSYRPFIVDGHRPELDVYFPDYKLGFECNGSRWHHSNPYYPAFKDKYYHRWKTEVFLQHGIKILHYWDWWDPSLFISVLNSKMGHHDKIIYARKLSVVEGKFASFLDENHLDGSCKCSFGYSLCLDGVPLAVMTFRKNNGDLEIARYAVKQGYSITGGFNRLISALKKSGYTGRLITYCNRDLCPDYHDSVYYRNGFSFLGDSGPILSYFVNKSYPGLKTGHHWRVDLQKHKLPKIFGVPSIEGTELDFLAKHGVFPMYNSGNWKFQLYL